MKIFCWKIAMTALVALLVVSCNGESDDNNGGGGVVPTGRCCYDSNTQCSVVTQTECASLGGDWTEGLNCDSTCGGVVPTGRCCYDNNTQCSVVTEAECVNVGGDWTEGLNCDSTCGGVAPTGRCCYDNNTQCSVVTQAECAGLGGDWIQVVDCNIPCCENINATDSLTHWPEDYPVDGDSIAVITVSNDSTGWMGNMVFEFYPDSAPNHVRNFKWLANHGFYDNVIFHRVIQGFVIQGGDPTGTGSGGCGWTISQEFNDIPHTRGILSMARTPDPNSAGSQFFVCHADAPHLNGQYTVFGNLIAGYDVLDRIATAPVQGSRPTPPIRMSSVCIRARP